MLPLWSNQAALMAWNLYADVARFRRRFANSSALSAGDQTEVIQVLQAASRRVDEHTRRHFYAETGTILFDGNGHDWLEVPDILAVTTLKLDIDQDDVYEVTLTAAADYRLLKEGDPDPYAGVPKTLLKLRPDAYVSTFYEQDALVQLVGRTGYTEEREAVLTSAGAAVTGTLADAADTTMVVSDLADLAIGQLLLIESEQVEILAGTVSPLTVRRGVNGTTAAAHAAAALTRYTFHPDIVEATLIQAGRLWKRRESAYSTVIANPQLGTVEVFKGMDPDALEYLAPFRRLGGVNSGMLI